MVSGSYSDLNAETVTAEIDSWFKMFLIDKGSEVEGVEGKPLLTATDTTFFLWLHRSASGTPGGVAAISWIDWILVRKYIEPEPSVSIGKEEIV